MRYKHFIDGHVIHLPVIDSTNLYTNKLLSQSGIEPWTIVLADFQTGGKGQRGRSWDSEAAQNLTFSVFLKPTVHARNHFCVSAAASLALVDALHKFNIKAEVKWPNDIIVGNRKIAGLLLENQIVGEQLTYCIAGIGINVNQIQFEPYRWPATSMRLERAITFDTLGVLSVFLDCFRNHVSMCETEPDHLVELINETLFGRGKLVTFEDHHETKTAIVREVKHDGALLLSVNGVDRTYYNGEITFTGIYP